MIFQKQCIREGPWRFREGFREAQSAGYPKRCVREGPWRFCEGFREGISKTLGSLKAREGPWRFPWSQAWRLWLGSSDLVVNSDFLAMAVCDFDPWGSQRMMRFPAPFPEAVSSEKLSEIPWRFREASVKDLVALFVIRGSGLLRTAPFHGLELFPLRIPLLFWRIHWFS